MSGSRTRVVGAPPTKLANGKFNSFCTYRLTIKNGWKHITMAYKEWVSTTKTELQAWHMHYVMGKKESLIQYINFVFEHISSERMSWLIFCCVKRMIIAYISKKVRRIPSWDFVYSPHLLLTIQTIQEHHLPLFWHRHCSRNVQRAFAYCLSSDTEEGQIS